MTERKHPPHEAIEGEEIVPLEDRPIHRIARAAQEARDTREKFESFGSTMARIASLEAIQRYMLAFPDSPTTKEIEQFLKPYDSDGGVFPHYIERISPLIEKITTELGPEGYDKLLADEPLTVDQKVNLQRLKLEHGINTKLETLGKELRGIAEFEIITRYAERYPETDLSKKILNTLQNFRVLGAPQWSISSLREQVEQFAKQIESELGEKQVP